MSMHRAWFPLEAQRSTGRLCSAGSGCQPVPRRQRSYAALRLPRSRRPRLRSPLAGGLPRHGCFFCAEPLRVASAGRARIRERAARRSLITGSPPLRNLPRRNVGLPGAWIVLFLRAVVVHPAGCGRPSALLRRDRRRLRVIRHPRPPGRHRFRGRIPTAHTLAYLRIAGRVCASGARLATGWAGSPFAGRGSHPLDDEPNFMKSSHPSFLSDPPCLVAPNYLRPSRPHAGPARGSALHGHRLPKALRLRALSVSRRGEQRNPRGARHRRLVSVDRPQRRQSVLHVQRGRALQDRGRRPLPQHVPGHRALRLHQPAVRRRQ